MRVQRTRRAMNTTFVKSILVAIAIVLLTSIAPVSPAMAGRQQLPQHVFVIVLENKTFDETFGPNSPAPYLSTTLTAQGELLTQYYATGHASLDNYISMVS